jgi:DNA-binding HxlR family transcriptional regulator
LTIAPVKPRAEGGARAGTEALRLLSTPINVHVLRALADGPRSLIDLRREAGSPPQTTMRGHLRALTETGVLIRRRQNDFPGSIDFELTSVGLELWGVAQILDAWLREAPEGQVQLGSSAAKSTVKALVEGWATSMVRALAARPFSLTELNGLISGLSYPSLERRLGALRLAGLIERTPGRGRGTPYAVTAWLRRSIAPLGAAARWERANAAATTAPIRRLDAEAAFLLAIPLLRLPASCSGVCRLAVEFGAGGSERMAGVLVEARDGQIVSCVARVQGHADAWAAGSAQDWLRAVIDGDRDRLELGGNCQLARAMLDGLNTELFRMLQRQA